MSEESYLNVGDEAPDFTASDQDKNEFSLSEHRGKYVLLSFHPLAWTPVCADQMKSLEANKETFDSLTAVAVGMSVDTVPSKKAWAESLGIKDTRLITDFWPHGDITMRYGIFNEEYGFSRRANIIVDKEGKIAWIKVYETKTLPDINEVLDVLKGMSQG